ncbi:MAG TPA: folylpolyglutamate synthase/dihydrofolate synthase family protein [Polyangiaceae bacterium]|nr:folylpolyglutamate synthase/dihydrofolate synthase family protein [Polyangiaceae bacterium]
MLADSLARLYARIPLGMRLGLDPMREACVRFGHPERAFESVHVAGTNGKGSVCAMVESIARAAGKRTGMFTSPHLCRFAERIQIAGEPLDDATLTATLERALDGAPELSFFETATLAAFLAFRDAKVDVAIVEVGIGGRLDATNVLPRPRAAAITRVALDHTDRLGPTLVDIAREKAGIAKAGLDLVLGPMTEDLRAEIAAVARAAGATTTPWRESGPTWTLRLEGEFQKDNARIAAELGARIGATPDALERGLASARWPGRLERIETALHGGPRRSFLIDAAHNPDGADALARHLRSLAIPAPQIALVFGTLGDKDWPAMLDALAPLAETRLYVGPQGGSRPAIDPVALAARHAGTAVPGVLAALERAIASGASLVVVAGSLVLVGEARALLLGLPRDPPVAL